MPTPTMNEMAVKFQEAARINWHVMRLQIHAGATRYATDMQDNLAHQYRMARAYMGITKGDVKKAETC